MKAHVPRDLAIKTSLCQTMLSSGTHCSCFLSVETGTQQSAVKMMCIKPWLLQSSDAAKGSRKRIRNTLCPCGTYLFSTTFYALWIPVFFLSNLISKSLSKFMSKIEWHGKDTTTTSNQFQTSFLKLQTTRVQFATSMCLRDRGIISSGYFPKCNSLSRSDWWGSHLCCFVVGIFTCCSMLWINVFPVQHT